MRRPMFSRFRRRRSGASVGPREVAARAHLEGLWESVRARVEVDAKLALLAEREVVTVPPDALQRGVDSYRDRRGLYSQEQTAAWLARAGLRLGQLVEYVQRRIQQDVLTQAAPTSAVREWFEQRRADYDAALVSVLSFSNEADAWLARAAVEQSDGAFTDLAWSRPHSDPALPLGGALGWRLRRQLPTGVAAQILDESGDAPLVGPILGGSMFYLYRVWERRPAAWTPALEAQCRQDYLADQIRTLPLP